MEGQWHVVQTNFPMWLKGDKTDPRFHYERLDRPGGPWLSDTVTYVQNGQLKRIKGVDKALNAPHTAFQWRGKGLLCLLTSRWDILHIDWSQGWAIIHFEASLFTPEGYDVIARRPILDAEERRAVARQLKRLDIKTALTELPLPPSSHTF